MTIRYFLNSLLIFAISVWSFSASAFLVPLGQNEPDYSEREVSIGTKRARLKEIDSNLEDLASGEKLQLLQIRPISDFITGAEGNHLSPNISPDGTKLSFIAQTSREAKMFMINFKTGQIGQIQVKTGSATEVSATSATGIGRRTRRRRYKERTVAADLAWSNDSRYYAFTSGGKIYLGMPQVPAPYLLVDEGAYVSHPRWSPNDQQLVYASGRTGNGDLYLLSNLDGFLERLQKDRMINPKNEAIRLNRKQSENFFLNRTRLTGALNSEEKTGEEDFATWLSNNRLIYHSYRGSTRGFDISEINFTKKKERTLLADLLKDQMYPRISPDGRKLAFYSNRWINRLRNDLPNEQLGKFALYLMALSENTDSSPTKAKAKTDQFTDSSVIPNTDKGVVWSPDSKYLVYIAGRTGEKYPIYVQHCDNQKKKNLTRSFPDVVNYTAVELASKSGKIIAFSAQKGAFQKLFVGVVNFPARQLGTGVQIENKER